MTIDQISGQESFFGQTDPASLLARFGSPLYVYNEQLLLRRCQEMLALTSYAPFQVNYSTKANSNLTLLRIIRQAGLAADAVSPGEIEVLLAAGFKPAEIFFVPNNAAAADLKMAAERGIRLSVDSLDQLDLFGRLAAGGQVSLRLNAGIGAGHHVNVITAGEHTKFGIAASELEQALSLASRYRLTIIGINQHIGSLFMQPEPYLAAARQFLSLAAQLPDLEFVDLGGGFGIPYQKAAGEERLDLVRLGQGLDQLLTDFSSSYGKKLTVKIEPGRYITAECGVLLGQVVALKENSSIKYAGTDLGFNVLARPLLYDSWHDILVYRAGQVLVPAETEAVTIVGNICESGDVLAKDRPLPQLMPDDILAILDSGAYGYAMSSNYNSRLRPAEVLIDQAGQARLIRRRETYADLLATCLEI